MLSRFRFGLLCCAAIVTNGLSFAQVWYVKSESQSELHDGLSWHTAFTTIQPAIDAAFASGGGEVWVAEGLYGEPRSFTVEGESIDRGALQLKDSVDVFGGFSGGETSRMERDFDANETIIDGRESLNGEASKNVIYAVADSTLDGFTIRGGNANDGVDAGGGVYCGDGSPVIANCKIQGNSSSRVGGGLFSSNGEPFISNCEFVENHTMGSGGGIRIFVAEHSGGIEPLVENCLIKGNTAAELGGGAFVDGAATFRRCRFVDNSVDSSVAGAGGGGMRLRGTAALENCDFIGNFSTQQGGAIYATGSFGFGQPPNPGYSTIARLLNCTFVDNSAPEGGAISYGEVLMAMVNCVEWDNGPDAWAPGLGGAGLVNINISHSIVSADTPESFTDDYEGNLRVDPRFVAPELGNYRLRPESPAVDSGTAAETIVPNNVPNFDVDAPSDDIEWTTRPIGEAHDMGAYEFDPEAFADPLDPSGDGMTNAVDVQLVINGALGAACDACDTNRDGSVDAVDVQFIINAVLGNV